MVAAVETMAYAGEKPWHGLGVEVSNDLTVDEMLEAAGLNWTVAREKLFLSDGAEVPGRFALVRKDNRTVLSTVGPQYKPVQNAEAFDFFKRFVDAGDMKMETAGSLQAGKHIWGMARLDQTFSLPGDDEVRSYLLVSQPHVQDKSLIIQYTPVRVVCWNTLTMALSQAAERGVFSMSHSSVFDDKIKERAALVLGLVSEQVVSFKEAAKQLAKKKAGGQQLEEYFCEVLEFDPSKAVLKKDGDPRLPRLLPKFWDAVERAPGQQLKSARGTWWGAFNAVTYTIDHMMVTPANDQDQALTKAWFGSGAQLKRRALDLAVTKAA